MPRLACLLALVLLAVPAAAQRYPSPVPRSGNHTPEIDWDLVAGQTLAGAAFSNPPAAAAAARGEPGWLALMPVTAAAGASLVGHATGAEGRAAKRISVTPLELNTSVFLPKPSKAY